MRYNILIVLEAVEDFTEMKPTACGGDTQSVATDDFFRSHRDGSLGLRENADRSLKSISFCTVVRTNSAIF